VSEQDLTAADRDVSGSFYFRRKNALFQRPISNGIGHDFFVSRIMNCPYTLIGKMGAKKSLVFVPAVPHTQVQF
jgi:hypothetical protein